MPILGSVIKRAIELRGKVPKVWGTKNAYKAQKRELKKLLRKAQYTAFGEHYKFQDILRQKDFVKNCITGLAYWGENTHFFELHAHLFVMNICNRTTVL